MTLVPATAMLPAHREDVMDEQDDYFDETTEGRWAASWWIVPSVILGVVMLVGLGWWIA